jgi:hypothetical protein
MTPRGKTTRQDLTARSGETGLDVTGRSGETGCDAIELGGEMPSDKTRRLYLTRLRATRRQNPTKLRGGIGPHSTEQGEAAELDSARHDSTQRPYRTTRHEPSRSGCTPCDLIRRRDRTSHNRTERLDQAAQRGETSPDAIRRLNTMRLRLTRRRNPTTHHEAAGSDDITRCG